MPLTERVFLTRSLAALWAVGAVLVLVTLVLPRSPAASELGLVTLATIGFGVAIALTCVETLPRLVFEAILGLAAALIGLGVHFSGEATSPYALYYVWLVVHACYFLPWRRAAIQLALVAGTYGLVLAVAPPGGHRGVHWAMTVATLAVTAALVGLMKHRVDRLMFGLSEAARKDSLTGLLNRRGFEEAFELEIERVRRGDRSLSVLVADLDHFKAINDRFGHGAGDDVLVAVAGVLADSTRRIDTCARIGGEEFAVILPDTDEQAAYQLAERLRPAVRASGLLQSCEPTLSIGIAAFPAHGTSAEDLMRAADQALYAAKGLGRDRSVIHSPEIAGILSQNGSPSGVAEIQLATLITLAETLDIRDARTAQHSQTVGRYAEMMARELGLEPDHVERLRLAGILHDIGKIGVADSVLFKEDPLTEEEWLEMRRHPEIGARLLGAGAFEDIREWVCAHHERPDGRGYPNRLTGDAIPLEARVLAVADAYEAMTSDRVYRPGMSHDAATQELERGAGTQFDPAVVEAFLAARRREAADQPQRRPREKTLAGVTET